MEQLFLDCEFTGLVQNTSLISLALYKDEENYFYAEFTDYNKKLMNAWLESNIIAQLFFNDTKSTLSKKGNVIKIKNSTTVILQHLKNWIKNFDDIQIWGDVPVYDWMLFCELFGGSLNLPNNVFYIPFDIATLGNITLKKRG